MFSFSVYEGSFDVVTIILVFCPVGFNTCLKEAMMKAISSFHEFFNIVSDEWTGAVTDLDGLHRSVSIEYLTKDVIVKTASLLFTSEPANNGSKESECEAKSSINRSGSWLL